MPKEKVKKAGNTSAKKSPLMIILAVICAVAIVAAGAMCFLRLQERKKQMEEQAELEKQEELENMQLQMVEVAMERALLAVERGKIEKVNFSEETKEALKAQSTGSIFSNTVVKEAIAKKFAQFYGGSDLNALMEFLTFLAANNVSATLEEGNAFDICFSEDYLEALKQSIVENAKYQSQNGENEIYTYQNCEFWLSSVVYIKWNYELEDKTRPTSIILGDTAYRKEQHKRYHERSVGYFMVDQDVELVMDEISATEKKTGNCKRCDGTGKVTVHFGKSWNQKPGYVYGQRCGKCNGTGWSD